MKFTWYGAGNDETGQEESEAGCAGLHGGQDHRLADEHQGQMKDLGSGHFTTNVGNVSPKSLITWTCSERCYSSACSGAECGCCSSFICALFWAVLHPAPAPPPGVRGFPVDQPGTAMTRLVSLQRSISRCRCSAIINEKLMVAGNLTECPAVNVQCLVNYSGAAVTRDTEHEARTS